MAATGLIKRVSNVNVLKVHVHKWNILYILSFIISS